MNANNADTSGPKIRPPLERRWHTLLDRTKLRLRARRHNRRSLALALILVLTVVAIGGYRFVTSDRQVEDLTAGYLG